MSVSLRVQHGPLSDDLFNHAVTIRFLGALESLYAMYGVPDRIESWVYQSSHDFKPEAKNKHLSF